jgi:hypothetical protein
MPLSHEQCPRRMSFKDKTRKTRRFISDEQYQTNSQTFNDAHRNDGNLRSSLCLGRLLVLNRGLLEVVGSISSGVLLLGQLGGCRCGAVDSLVLLGGLAGRVCGAIGALVLLSLETLNLLLGLLDVLEIKVSIELTLGHDNALTSLVLRSWSPFQ